MVMAVFDKAFDIFILRLGVTKRVYCDVSKSSTVYTVKPVLSGHSKIVRSLKNSQNKGLKDKW